MNQINTSKIVIQEDFINLPKIGITIYVDNIVKYHSVYDIVDGWLNVLKKELEDRKVYAKYEKYKIKISLKNYIFNRKISTSYESEGDLNFLCIDPCIRKLLNYARKKEMDG